MQRSLLELMYEAASIQRWNDHIRPHKGFTELDKQGHKMYFTYILAKMEEIDSGAKIDWSGLIEGALFEFFHRVVVTDIKPPIYYKLMEKKERELNNWVLGQLKDKFAGVNSGFFDRFKTYLMDTESHKYEKKILKAAHYLATDWEFKFIYRLSYGLYGLEETKRRIENEIEEHYNLIGVQKIKAGKKTSDFVDLIGQLRFQQRWAQSPRIPETSVMGHMLVVAMLAYFYTLQLKEGQPSLSRRRLYNNFFGGLFHDLPEVLTRDIVSPVKRSVEGLEELIKDIENRQIEETIFPLLPKQLNEEIKYLTDDEFASKIRFKEGNKIQQKKVGTRAINREYDADDYNPVDGEIIGACDKLAAYAEACISLQHGIKSNHIVQGARNLYSKNKDGKIDGGIDMEPIYEAFRDCFEPGKEKRSK